MTIKKGKPSTMKVLVVLSLLGLACGLPATPTELPALKYHETVGIPQATRIKAAEQAIDFSGSKISGGSAASLGEYPHLGGLVITLTIGSESVCGSSLLTNTRAITAAHCWFDGWYQASHFTVVLGSTTLFSGGTRVTTSSVVMHEDWNTKDLVNDLAVISLSWVNFSNNIRGIALPSGSGLLANTYAGWTARIAGFGLQGGSQTGISPTQTLHHASVTIMKNSDCRKWWPTVVGSSHICIDTSSKRSTCGGDSGGPLQVTSGDMEVLVGVTCFGYLYGCEEGWPAVFTRVTAFNNWIRARL